MQLVVIAKEPVPGLVKTRLCPPCTPEEAAVIAEAAIADTLATVAATPANRRVVALDGRPGPWLPDDFDVVAQRGGGLANRLFGAFEDCFHVSAEPVVLIGMDTPQVTVDHLLRAAMAIETGADAVIGMAPDGGYWLVALRHLHPGAFAGVPMSADDTGAAQLDRLQECGYRVAITEELRDVDDARDAVDVAAQIPGSRFAAAVEAVFGPPD
jgi:rSAM/selenodomain-associated transferase 1